MKEPAIGNFFSGCWPNYQTNYSSLNCFGGLVLSRVGFGSFSGALLGLQKNSGVRIQESEFIMISVLIADSTALASPR
ncbi:hypothetical protein [Nostoc sp. CCY 9925]|uniref:hypothetical protein n=1 Tax=Nostoc sp. CCY 9925 TaxID=3103865 RepID=UPI0039C71AFC